MSRKCPFCNASVPAADALCPGCGGYLGAAAEDEGSAPDEAGGSKTDTPSLVARLLAQDKKLEAIRVYRETSGVSLAEAKAAVEAIGAAYTGRNLHTDSAATKKTPIDDAFESELVALLRQGQWITAIKNYRERTGSQLQESKTFIDALAVRNGMRPMPSGFSGVIAVMVIVAIVGAIVVFAMLFDLTS